MKRLKKQILGVVQGVHRLPKNGADSYSATNQQRVDFALCGLFRACRQESREMYFVCTGFKGRDKMSHEVQIKGSFSAREGYA